MSEIVTPTELKTLLDRQLVELIMERSNLDRDGAREALTIIRGEIPENVTV